MSTASAFRSPIVAAAPANAFRPSASRTTGTGEARTRSRTNPTVSWLGPEARPDGERVRGARPRRGPRRAPRPPRSPVAVSASGTPTASGTPARIAPSAPAGAATTTYPAPVRWAAPATSRAAPGIARDPATTRTAPAAFLCASVARGAMAASTSSGSVSPVALGTSSSGNPMSTTRRSPVSSAPGRSTVPVFGAPIATVSRASTAGPGTAPVAPSTPLGMSTATTGHGASRSASMAAARSPSAAPWNPVPTSASIARSARSSDRPSRARSCPGTSTTSTRIPAAARCPAAIRPSSPLCPVPARTTARRP